jgi:hypothetical protein
VRQLLVTVNVVPSTQIFVTPLMEALHSSETSVLMRAPWRNDPEYGILHSYRVKTSNFASNILYLDQKFSFYAGKVWKKICIAEFLKTTRYQRTVETHSEV